MSNILRITYDENALDIMDNVNDVLKCHNLKFVNDNLLHDGVEVYSLERIGGTNEYVTKDSEGSSLRK